MEWSIMYRSGYWRGYQEYTIGADESNVPQFKSFDIRCSRYGCVLWTSWRSPIPKVTSIMRSKDPAIIDVSTASLSALAHVSWWVTRGWTLSQEVFSSKLLIFTKEQVFLSVESDAWLWGRCSRWVEKCFSRAQNFARVCAGETF